MTSCSKKIMLTTLTEGPQDMAVRDSDAAADAEHDDEVSLQTMECRIQRHIVQRRSIVTPSLRSAAKPLEHHLGKDARCEPSCKEHPHSGPCCRAHVQSAEGITHIDTKVCYCTPSGGLFCEMHCSSSFCDAG